MFEEELSVIRFKTVIYIEIDFRCFCVVSACSVVSCPFSNTCARIAMIFLQNST